MRRLFAKLPIGGVISGLLVAALVIGVRLTGGLQSLELYAYDHYVQARAGDSAAPSPVVLVGADEHSLMTYGWPLNDRIVADLLDRLVAAGATVVGFDIYRDRPEPPGTARLNAVLADNSEIVAVYKFADAQGSRVEPPPVLARTDRFGFADLLVDGGGIVRRSLLFMDDGEGTGQSFAFRLAAAYLGRAGIFAAPDDEHPESLRLGPVTIARIDGNHGAYVGTDARGYQYVLDYRRGRQPFPVHSVADVLEGRIDTTVFADKLVIVGTAAVSVRDHFFTPFSDSRRPERAAHGMEITRRADARQALSRLEGVRQRNLAEIQKRARRRPGRGASGLVGRNRLPGCDAPRINKSFLRRNAEPPGQRLRPGRRGARFHGGRLIEAVQKL